MAKQSVRVGIIGLSVGALLLTACSSGGSTTASTAGPASAAAASAPAASLDPETAAIAAEATRFAELPLVEQEKELATSSLAAELSLLPESDAKAYTAMATDLASYVRSTTAKPSFGRFGAGPVFAEDMGYGGMLFAGWIVASLGISAAISGSDNAQEGSKSEALTDKRSAKTASSETNFTGSVETATFDMTATSTEKGMTGSLHVKATVNPCPDVGGLFRAKATVDATGGASNGGTMSSTVDISMQGLVNDHADVIGYETTTNTRATSSAGLPGADITLTRQDTGGASTITGVKVEPTPGATVGSTKVWAFLGTATELMVMDQMMKAIKKSIESGRCVKLNAPTNPAKTTHMKPSTPVSISAQPRSKVDGKPTGGTVTGTLEGGAALDPAGTPVDADATFSYTAPDKEDERAVVKLEARSLRGVGRTEVPMDTTKAGGYTIDQTIGQYRYTGKACSIAGPWTITYELLDMPGLKGGGTYKLTFPAEPPGEGETVAGKGTEKGKIEAVGLPGGVKFNAGLTATLTPAGSDYTMVVKSTGGSSMAWAEDKTGTGTVGVSTVELKAVQSSSVTCPAR